MLQRTTRTTVGTGRRYQRSAHPVQGAGSRLAARAGGTAQAPACRSDHGAAHAVYGVFGSDCVDTTVNTYLATGRLPSTDVTCARSAG
ncbi:alpha/beta hydrolase [Streptomyces sp. NPDC088254]|uniref:alpha/beta hydrolase n=1 Tax=Streptomyces sp. NPDC088254 TaxID=3365847 RepID=UPI00381A87B5